jgi:hypothetical protein
MGQRIVSAVSISAALMLAAVPALAQGQSPRPGQLPPPQQRQQPAQQPAAKAYKAVAISAPKPIADPGLETFRKQLIDVADKKDRRALAGLVSKSFFWMGENGDKADKKKSAIDNLAKAIGLGGKDADGWDALAGYASDPTGMPLPERKDTICAPAEPDFDGQAFEALLKATGTDDGDWGYPVQPGLEMRASVRPNAPIIEKLGMHFVRVMDDESAAHAQIPMLKVVAPSGKTGFVPADTISPLGGDQICYVKEAGGWKIGGFIGGE